MQLDLFEFREFFRSPRNPQLWAALYARPTIKPASYRRVIVADSIFTQKTL